jgi:hypothetical protein
MRARLLLLSLTFVSVRATLVMSFVCASFQGEMVTYSYAPGHCGNTIHFSLSLRGKILGSLYTWLSVAALSQGLKYALFFFDSQ